MESASAQGPTARIVASVPTERIKVMALIAVTTDHVAYEHSQEWELLDTLSMSEVRKLHRELHEQAESYEELGHSHLHN